MNKAVRTPPRQVKFSIFAQCAVIIAAAVTIVAATVTTSSFVQTRQIAFAGLLTKAEAVTRSIAAPAGGAIRFARSEGLVQEIDLLYTAAGGQAVAAVVTDAAGSRIVAGGPGLGAHASDLAALAAEAVATGRGVTDGARFLVAEPVRFGADGEVVGAVAIAWSTDAMSGALARARYEVLGLAALALGTALAGGILLLRRSVTQPLREIGRAMKTVVGGAYDIVIPQAGRRDEIGLMARDLEYFRNMMSDASDATKAARFQSAAFRSSSAAMVLADRDFNITMTNAAFETLCRNNEADFASTFQGFELATLVGRNIDVFHGNPTRNRKMILEPDALPMKTDIRIA
jgi:methyl-accepting chemotaxis protein